LLGEVEALSGINNREEDLSQSAVSLFSQKTMKPTKVSLDREKRTEMERTGI
jgi:hypothetical protein